MKKYQNWLNSSQQSLLGDKHAEYLALSQPSTSCSPSQMEFKPSKDPHVRTHSMKVYLFYFDSKVSLDRNKKVYCFESLRKKSNWEFESNTKSKRKSKNYIALKSNSYILISCESLFYFNPP